MFDIGWQELFIVGLITIIVVGPKELPRVLRTATLWIKKIKGMAREFQDGLEDLAREADLDDLQKELESSAGFDLEGELETTIDPGGELGDAVRELGDVAKEEPDSKPEPKSKPKLKPKPKPKSKSKSVADVPDGDAPDAQPPAGKSGDAA